MKFIKVHLPPNVVGGGTYLVNAERILSVSPGAIQVVWNSNITIFSGNELRQIFAVETPEEILALLENS